MKRPKKHLTLVPTYKGHSLHPVLPLQISRGYRSTPPPGLPPTREIREYLRLATTQTLEWIHTKSCEGREGVLHEISDFLAWRCRL